MADSHEAPDGQSVDLSQNYMSERLWRRANEPAGVIDVRYAQQKYWSIMRWLGERAALLDHLKSRYAVEETRAGGEHLFAAPDSSGQQMNIFQTTIQSFSTAAQAEATPADASQDQAGWGRQPSSLAEVIAAHSLKPPVEPEASIERRFRISRRQPARLPESDDPSLARSPQIASAQQPQTALPIQPPPVAAPPSQPTPMDTASRRNRVTESQVIDQAAQDFVFQKRLVGSPEVEEAVENKNMSAQPKPARKTMSREQESAASGGAPPDDGEAVSVQSQSGLTVSLLPLVKPLAVVSSEQEDAASQVVQRDDSEGVGIQSQSKPAASPLPLIKPLVTSSDREVTIAQSQGESSVSPLPIVKASAGQLHVESPLPGVKTSAVPLNVDSLLLSRSPKTISESPSADVAAQRSIGMIPNSNPTAVFAPEIHDDSSNLQRPEIVWRKPPGDAGAAHFMAQAPGTSEQAVPVQFSPAASIPVVQQGGQTGTSTRAQTQSEPVQVDHLSPQIIRAISERVLRAITLDLKLERERRGITKWR